MMKVALMINKANFERYSDPGAVPKNWELVHLGNGEPDEDRIIATDADAIVVDSILPVSAKVIQGMPHLKIIQTQGVGFNKVDLQAAKDAGVYVTNCAGANAVAVAEQAIMLMLVILRRFRENEDMVYACKQIEAKNRCFENGINELGDCHVGIVGLGAIGLEIAQRLKAFGSRLSYFDTFVRQDCEIPLLSLDEIYAQCDIITLHVPVLPETTGMINEDTINKMKRGAILIDTARGELIDHDAVCRALIDGRLGGAGIDTLYPEPVEPDNPFLSLPEDIRKKVALSPHIGGITAGSFYRYYETIWSNLRKVAQGERPSKIVNGL